MKSQGSREKSGIVLAYKPAGMGSTALVSRLKRTLGVKKAGHAGTLDRSAEGLMILLTGKATPLADFLLKHDKTYQATFRWGLATDTHDLEGSVTESLSPAEARERFQAIESKIHTTIALFTEQKEQVPPLYSALKSGGKRFSDRARSGQSVLPEPRPVKIYRAQMLPDRGAQKDSGEGYPQTAAFFSVGSGTYIRSIARDLGEALAIPVTLSRLIRLSMGDVSIQGDYPVWILPSDGEEEENENDAEPRGEGIITNGNTWPEILSPLAFLSDWKQVQIQGEDRIKRLMHGNQLDLPAEFLDTLAAGENFFITAATGELLAWACAGGSDGLEGATGYRYRRVFTSE